jgi:four helix bundle protein
MTKQELLQRTKSYVLRVIKVVQALPRDDVAKVLGKQLLRAGTSVGANYRAACRGRSAADFIGKLKIVEEEADESLYWMDLLVESNIMPQRRLAALMCEGNEIVSMIVAAIKTTRAARTS